MFVLIDMNKAKYLFTVAGLAIAILCSVAVFSCRDNCHPPPAAPMQPNIISESEPSFRMRIGDVFTIECRGVVVSGHIEKGSVGPGGVQVGDSLIVKGQKGNFSVTVLGIESLRKSENETAGSRGDSVGIFLRGITRDQVYYRDLLVKY